MKTIILQKIRGRLPSFLRNYSFCSELLDGTKTFVTPVFQPARRADWKVGITLLTSPPLRTDSPKFAWQMCAVIVALAFQMTAGGAEPIVQWATVATPQSFSGMDLTETLSLPLPDSPPKAVRSFAHVPLSFERNEGQIEAEAKFLVRARGYHLYLSQAEAVMVLLEPRKRNAGFPVGQARRLENRRYGAEADDSPTGRGNTVSGSDVLRMKLVGAYLDASISGESELPGKVNYFVGNDPSLWRTNISTFAKVRYHEVYPGIDLVYYGNEGQLEYDFIVAPGADPRRIQLAIEGADKIQLDERGDLQLSVGGKELRWHKPRIFQQINGSQVEIAGGYGLQPLALKEEPGTTRGIAFHVAAYDSTRALIIDPVLIYSTYLGGGASDVANGVAVDSQGSAYITGFTWNNSSFPTTI